MILTQNAIPFVKLVQQTVFGNYEPIMGIWGEIFNLHNLQILFMLWIKYKFSECLAPCTNMKAYNGRLSGDCSAQARKHGVHSWTVTTKSFLFHPRFCCLQKTLFWTCDKNKNISSLKWILRPFTLKAGYGSGSAKILSAIWYVV